MNTFPATQWTRHTRKLLVGGLFVALVGAAVMAQAESGPMGWHRHHGVAEAAGGPMGAMMPGMMGGRHAERMLEAAGVSAEQRAQIRQLVDAARKEAQATRDDGRKLHEQMRQLFTQPTVDANAAEALRQQQMARHEAASKRRMQLMLDVSRVLTPEQRTKLAELAGKRGGMLRHGAGPK
ncbi:MAG: Spy/CpxP family protein refolding chaperone [Rubrivivax sp.]|nr:Spy/CpxP family protein refolding chaperone [Rubrivivax sp.]